MTGFRSRPCCLARINVLHTRLALVATKAWPSFGLSHTMAVLSDGDSCYLYRNSAIPVSADPIHSPEGGVDVMEQVMVFPPHPRSLVKFMHQPFVVFLLSLWEQELPVLRALAGPILQNGR